MGIIVKILKIGAITMICAVVAVACGLYWEHLAWQPCESPCPGRPWLGYFVIGWFRWLIGAYGEGAYDAYTVEVMIHFFLILLAIWFLIKFFRRKHRIASD